MTRPAPLPWRRAAREAEAARLSPAEVRALACDERCDWHAEFLSQRDIAYLRWFAYRLKRRHWSERLDDTL